MTFKELKQTVAYKTASVIELYDDETGKEIDNIPNKALDNMEVVDFCIASGFLSATLR